MPSQPLVVATDGSCLGNPGHGGWAWVVGPDCWAAGGHPGTTNNLMELRAVYELLTVVPQAQPLVIETDSEYVVNVFTRWVDGWIARGWRTASRRPVANRVAIEQIAAILAGRPVEWRHVRGHAGHQLNELADLHARTAAEASQLGREAPAGDPACLRRHLTLQ